VSSKPNSTKISQEKWKVWAEIDLLPQVAHGTNVTELIFTKFALA
jgi:hypothetical protein